MKVSGIYGIKNKKTWSWYKMKMGEKRRKYLAEKGYIKRICQKCGIEIHRWAEVGGKMKFIGKRKFCLDCYPLRSGLKPIGWII